MQACILMLALRCALQSAVVPLAAAHAGPAPFVAARAAMFSVPAVGAVPAARTDSLHWSFAPPRLMAPTRESAERYAVGPTLARPAGPTYAPLDTPVRRRARAIEYSDWYARRLLVHRLASYTMLPLFAVEYPLGRDLLYGTNVSSWEKPTHQLVAGAIGGLFALNTVTGAWNLWDSRHDPAGRTKRIIHSTLLLASDAGFVWTGVLGSESKRSFDKGRLHRNVAIGSMSLATAGTALMWFFRD